MINAGRQPDTRPRNSFFPQYRQVRSHGALLSVICYPLPAIRYPKTAKFFATSRTGGLAQVLDAFLAGHGLFRSLSGSRVSSSALTANG
jgi:hypothetical protein